MNLLDAHVLAEDFFRDLLNLVYGWQLQNINQWNQNAKGVDLWYGNGKIIVQVSSTNTKSKIQSSLDKLRDNQYDGYSFKFLRIDGNVKRLRKESYSIPDGILFDPVNDIIDISSLLNEITHLEIGTLKSVCELCEKEIQVGVPRITETDLAIVVRTLASNINDWSRRRMPIVFDVDKKISFNQLDKKKRLINDYKLYIGKLNSVYQAFVDNGTDYSFIILQNLSDLYSRYLGEYGSDALFNRIVAETKKIALKGSSAEAISDDRLDVCIYVIVVDAFVRCRIFEDPEGYNYVDA